MVLVTQSKEKQIPFRVIIQINDWRWLPWLQFSFHDSNQRIISFLLFFILSAPAEANKTIVGHMCWAQEYGWKHFCVQLTKIAIIAHGILNDFYCLGKLTVDQLNYRFRDFYLRIFFFFFFFCSVPTRINNTHTHTSHNINSKRPSRSYRLVNNKKI